MYSQERRMERYQIIYTWKILDEIATNVGIKSYTSTRQGRLCWVPLIKQCASGKIRAIREGSLQIRGPHLFNSLPVNICGQTQCSVTRFMHKLDKYQQNIPDKPKIPGYTIEMDTNYITSMRSSRESWAESNLHFRRTKISKVLRLYSSHTLIKYILSYVKLNLPLGSGWLPSKPAVGGMIGMFSPICWFRTSNQSEASMSGTD